MPHSAPLRSQITTALDELVAHEEGMRFQALSIVLAKQRWPDLVASERRSDLGLDAFVTRDNARDGIGRGLASSITATYSKVSDDAKTASEHFGDSIQHLVFSTPRIVSNLKKLQWAKQIQQECGYRLEVISREDLISDLSGPQNAPLCQTFLRLNIQLEEGEQELVWRIRQAAQAETETWARRVAGRRLMELESSPFDKKGNSGGETWTLSSIVEALRGSRRLIVEGLAGYGKTTTLIQLALGPLRNNGVPILIDLNRWTESGNDILSFVAGMPSFQRANLAAQELARSESSVRFYFLLNGWNEISQSNITSAGDALRELERQFPAAGILVATRSQLVSPPLPGAMRLRLRRVRHRTRSAYIRECLGERASALLASIEADPTLDDLTRTPFLLAEIVALAEAGREIPRQRTQVIEAAIELLEAAPEHAAALTVSPLEGMAGRFLEALASRMMPAGAVDLSEDEARRVTSRTTGDLASEGLLSHGSSAATSLGALCAHHVLERFDYPIAGYRFGHQLFEDYYAFRWLERHFQAITDSSTGGIEAFAREFLNEPAWTTPLEMLAESLGASTTPSDLRASPSVLVQAALSVDLVLTARLAFLAAIRSDAPVAKQLQDRLRDWHSSSDEHHRRCALAAMLTSGMDAFKDIVEPLLSSPDQQLRLETLRIGGDTSPHVLGTAWRDTVSTWPEAARADFIAKLLRERFDSDIAHFGLVDASAHVRVATAEALDWIGAEQELSVALSAFDDQTFALFIATISYRAIPPALHLRARHQLRQRLGQVDGVAQRIRTLLALHDLSDSEAVDDLKAALLSIPDELASDFVRHVLVPAVDVLYVADPEWTGDWVARRLGNDRLWGDFWMKYVSSVPTDLCESLYLQLATEDLGHPQVNSRVTLVAKGAHADLARRAFLRVLEIWTAIKASDGRAPKVDSSTLRQLAMLLQEMAPSLVIAALADKLTAEPDLLFLEAFSHIYGRTTSTESPLSMLDDGSRTLLGNYLRTSIPLLLEQDDFAGELKAEVACCLSHVGRPEDISELMKLVRADLQRVRIGREARARGERTRAAGAAPISWTATYVRAVIALLGDNADDVLLELLREPEYERSLLEAYARHFASPENGHSSRSANYARVWAARMEAPTPLEQDQQRARVAQAIRDRIRHFEETRGSETEEPHLNMRLKAMALGLAGVAPRHFADEIIALLGLPAEFDAPVCVDALQQLLFAGAPLPSDQCLPLLDRWLEHRNKWGVQDQDRWTIMSFLQICMFVDNPAAGVAKIRAVIHDARLGIYDLRDLLPALGNSRCDSALSFMLEMVAAESAWQAVEHEWTNALVLLDNRHIRDLLLGLVDPSLPGFPHQFGWHTGGVVARRLAELASKIHEVDSRLNELSRLQLDEPHRQFLARTLALRGTPAAKLAVLNLMNDTQQPAVPAAVAECLASTFGEDSAHATYSHVIVRHPAEENAVRSTLYRMVFTDHLRKRAAYSLLGQIEAWRLEYGRPLGEPRHPDLTVGRPWPPPDPAVQE